METRIEPRFHVAGPVQDNTQLPSDFPTKVNNMLTEDKSPRIFYWCCQKACKYSSRLDTVKFAPAVLDKRGAESGVKIFAVCGREEDKASDSTPCACTVELLLMW